eukprot:CAMPEP_0206135488 /NCGR_PEP_ID=MMETSP1473-20131121/764_1 /ASSEMBLY_ACC=CAM_ASM_001109 /TAXON_ID=1461547 /ORGANISM="Stichococcus sp, Strain RCC1054" /LENGTH=41 /DNA_ID= /DNA_START= /DNA_END= /DNA_ORIENTATION=
MGLEAELWREFWANTGGSSSSMLLPDPAADILPPHRSETVL